MKKIFFATIILAFAIVTKAQPSKPPSIEERLKHTNEILQKEVQPNAAQKTAIDYALQNIFYCC